MEDKRDSEALYNLLYDHGCNRGSGTAMKTEDLPFGYILIFQILIDDCRFEFELTEGKVTAISIRDCRLQGLNLHGGLVALEFLNFSEMCSIRVAGGIGGVSDVELLRAVGNWIALTATSNSTLSPDYTLKASKQLSKHMSRVSDCFSAVRLSALRKEVHIALEKLGGIAVTGRGHLIEHMGLIEVSAEEISPLLCREMMPEVKGIDEDMFAESITRHILNHHRVFVTKDSTKSATPEAIKESLRRESSKLQYIRFTPDMDMTSLAVHEKFHLVLSEEELVNDTYESILAEIVERYPSSHSFIVKSVDLDVARLSRKVDSLSVNSIVFLGSGMKSIPDGFFRSYRELGRKLSSIDIFSLPSVTVVGDRFLSRSGLTAIDLSSLSNVTSIGDSFLDWCMRLAAVDLTPLSSVTAIGHSFLCECRRLTAIDLTPLSSVTSIGDNFLQWSVGITAIDLLSLSSVTSIGDNFLYACHGLTSINLGYLPLLGSIGAEFLGNCKNIQTISAATDAKTTRKFVLRHLIHLNLKRIKILTRDQT